MSVEALRYLGEFGADTSCVVNMPESFEEVWINSGVFEKQNGFIRRHNEMIYQISKQLLGNAHQLTCEIQGGGNTPMRTVLKIIDSEVSE
ncbi:hypothetical protein [Paenibacillus kandeliae]|uniref:hypothetical protein n=1 Tax=Paenibacillus kandeliae TaxID=3231269 RepID=UPI003458C8B9